MVGTVIEKDVDIYQYPCEFEANLEANLGAVTIGDLHGNSVKLLHFLLRHNIIGFKLGIDAEQSYNNFVTVYEQIGEVAKEIKKNQAIIYRESDRVTNYYQIKIARYHQLDQQEGKTDEELKELASINIEQFMRFIADSESKIKQAQVELPALIEKLSSLVRDFNQFMEQLEVVDDKALVRLIGDELADRGSNDYFTLRILGFLRNEGVKVNITISNHSNEFITAYERLALQQGFNAQDQIGDSQKVSFVGLKVLLDEGLVTETEVTQLVNEAYKPTLKIIDYTLNDNRINLFTHAPVAFDIIKHLAASVEVVYDDSTKEALAATIDKINTKFEQVVRDNRVHEFCNVDDDELNPDHMTLEQIERHPLINIIWNRWSSEKDTAEARPASKNGYSVGYLHGHDPYQSKYEHVVNLDTSCGKGSRKDTEDKIKVAERAVRENASDKQAAEQFLDGINKYKVWNSDERSLNQKHGLELIDEEFKQHQLMSRGTRAGLISGIAAGIGLVLGAALGVALVATGVFAPFGVGILAVVALAAAVGGGVAFIAGLFGFAVAKATQVSKVTNTLLDSSEANSENNSLVVLGRGLGPNTQSSSESVANCPDESHRTADLTTATDLNSGIDPINTEQQRPSFR